MTKQAKTGVNKERKDSRINMTGFELDSHFIIMYPEYLYTCEGAEIFILTRLEELRYGHNKNAKIKRITAR